MNASRLWASRGQGPYPKSSLFSPCTPSLRDLIHPMASTTTCMPRTLSAGLSPACHGPALQPSRVAGCRMLCWTPPGHQNPTCPVSSEPTLAPGSGALFRQSKAQRYSYGLSLMEKNAYTWMLSKTANLSNCWDIVNSFMLNIQVERWRNASEWVALSGEKWLMFSLAQFCFLNLLP